MTFDHIMPVSCIAFDTGQIISSALFCFIYDFERRWLDLHDVEQWVSMNTDSGIMCEWSGGGLISGTFLEVRRKSRRILI